MTAMCKCTPGIKTPFCGKPGCQWPEQRPSKDVSDLSYVPRYPHWTCKTHGDFDARTAVGCPECVRLLREDCRRWENAHKILLSENDRLKKQLETAAQRIESYERLRNPAKGRLLRAAGEPRVVEATNGFGISAMWCAVCGSKEGDSHLVGCPYAGASQPPRDEQ
jgi:hypothetical protein